MCSAPGQVICLAIAPRRTDGDSGHLPTSTELAMDIRFQAVPGAYIGFSLFPSPSFPVGPCTTHTRTSSLFLFSAASTMGSDLSEHIDACTLSVCVCMCVIIKNVFFVQRCYPFTENLMMATGVGGEEGANHLSRTPLLLLIQSRRSWVCEESVPRLYTHTHVHTHTHIHTQ